MTAQGTASHQPPRGAETLAVDHASLISAIASTQDREAFSVLFNAFAPMVKSYMMKRGAAPELAEDLAIETFVKFWTKAAAFNPSHGSAAGWIFTIARNTYIDVARRERHPSQLMAVDDATTPTRPDDDFLKGERESRVRAAMRELPTEQAQVPQMSFCKTARTPKSPRR